MTSSTLINSNATANCSMTSAVWQEVIKNYEREGGGVQNTLHVHKRPAGKRAGSCFFVVTAL